MRLGKKAACEGTERRDALALSKGWNGRMPRHRYTDETIPVPRGEELRIQQSRHMSVFVRACMTEAGFNRGAVI